MKRKRLHIICGAYGSGKTEFAIAYALDIHKQNRSKVGLIDLDIVNPYFRSRDIAGDLEEKG
ncbi:MAG TPA: ATP-binding protein, partial [Firmicutes bacterium]|nr:ATP-binding protein [Bacillota bacterium]